MENSRCTAKCQGPLQLLSPPFLMTSTTKQMQPNGSGYFTVTHDSRHHMYSIDKCTESYGKCLVLVKKTLVLPQNVKKCRKLRPKVTTRFSSACWHLVFVCYISSMLHSLSARWHGLYIAVCTVFQDVRYTLCSTCMSMCFFAFSRSGFMECGWYSTRGWFFHWYL